MAYVHQLPVAVRLSEDIEHRPDRELPYRARVRWIDPQTGRRRSLSRSYPASDAAQEWVDAPRAASSRGLDPAAATTYGTPA